MKTITLILLLCCGSAFGQASVLMKQVRPQNTRHRRIVVQTAAEAAAMMPAPASPRTNLYPCSMQWQASPDLDPVGLVNPYPNNFWRPSYLLKWGPDMGSITNWVGLGNVTNITMQWPKAPGRYVQVMAVETVTGTNLFLNGTNWSAALVTNTYLSDPATNTLFWPPAVQTTNIITVRTVGPLQSGPSPRGPWTLLSTNSVTYTNPPGVMFFRGAGATITKRTP